jgi:Fe-S oxidoreductase
VNILGKIFQGNTLYYPGCMTKLILKNIQEKYEKILRNCGIDFITLKDLEFCCGSPVKNAGYFEDFKKLAEKNFKTFREHSVKRIVFNCPACFYTFSREYKKLLPKWNIETEHIVTLIWNMIKRGKLKLKKVDKSVKVSYHDPCYLGRYSGIYDEPRNIIRELGYELIEMKLNREKALCCGGGGGLRSNFLELSKEISRERIKDAESAGVEILITTCPMCYVCLKENSKKVRVLELSELL